MIRYECDRCGAEDTLHMREVTVEIMRVIMTPNDEARIDLHLCGYCTSKFREFVEGDPRDDKELERLAKWKAEATPLLNSLDRCHDLLPLAEQARLGESKAKAVEMYLERQHRARNA